MVPASSAWTVVAPRAAAEQTRQRRGQMTTVYRGAPAVLSLPSSPLPPPRLRAARLPAARGLGWEQGGSRAPQSDIGGALPMHEAARDATQQDGQAYQDEAGAVAS